MGTNIASTEYEAEAWETGSRHSDDTGYDSKSRSRYNDRSREESPHTYHQASQAGDYYRDTNLTYNNNSNPNLRLAAGGPGSQASHSNISHRSGAAPQPAMSQYGGGLPQIPFMPLGGGPPSVTGSDYAAHAMPMMPQLGYQNTGSMYGMPLSMNMMASGSFQGSQPGGFNGVAPSVNPFAGGLPQQRPMSTFSFATSVNPFATPSNSENPTDEELFQALRNYLSTQDLMTVTKK